jgi:hypothetical protein
MVRLGGGIVAARRFRQFLVGCADPADFDGIDFFP